MDFQCFDIGYGIYFMSEKERYFVFHSDLGREQFFFYIHVFVKRPQYLLSTYSIFLVPTVPLLYPENLLSTQSLSSVPTVSPQYQQYPPFPVPKV